ncbi:MAG: type II secretion system minor pseudopilin GspK [Desulforhopalus sp.]|nr:type II secretion system minor pseudopilin GspK [Desulforhopalus sp.]
MTGIRSNEKTGRLGTDAPRWSLRDPWRNQRGMALLITIMVLALMVVITIQYHKTIWQKYSASHTRKVATQLKTIAGSAVQIGCALLRYDGTAATVDSFLDPWASVWEDDFHGLFPTGAMHLEIIDLSGRLQVNSLAATKGGKGTKTAGQGRNAQNGSQAILLRLLQSGAFAVADETQARQIVDALVDWLDTDERESDHGAENSYYRSLNPPYSCKNGPVEYIEELLLVRGMTPQLLFGTGTTKALADYLTVFGDDGKININTAPRLLIKSLDPLIGEEVLDHLDAYRRDPKHAENLGDPQWYKNIGGWPSDSMLYDKMLTTQSVFFQVTGAGRLDASEKKMTIVVERVSGGRLKLLSKNVD